MKLRGVAGSCPAGLWGSHALFVDAFLLTLCAHVPQLCVLGLPCCPIHAQSLTLECWHLLCALRLLGYMLEVLGNCTLRPFAAALRYLKPVT